MTNNSLIPKTTCYIIISTLFRRAMERIVRVPGLVFFFFFYLTVQYSIRATLFFISFFNRCVHIYPEKGIFHRLPSVSGNCSDSIPLSKSGEHIFVRCIALLQLPNKIQDGGQNVTKFNMAAKTSEL